MEISSQANFYSPIPLPGGAMFHRCCPRQASDADCTRIRQRARRNRKLMLRQLFISGAVAACNMDVLIALP
jgi:hypothetical protein